MWLNYEIDYEAPTTEWVSKQLQEITQIQKRDNDLSTLEYFYYGKHGSTWKERKKSWLINVGF